MEKVTKVARMLAAKHMDMEMEQKSCTVMALLDGGMLKRHKSWLKVTYSNDSICTVSSFMEFYVYYCCLKNQNTKKWISLKCTPAQCVKV